MKHCVVQQCHRHTIILLVVLCISAIWHNNNVVCSLVRCVRINKHTISYVLDVIIRTDIMNWHLLVFGIIPYICTYNICYDCNVINILLIGPTDVVPDHCRHHTYFFFSFFFSSSFFFAVCWDIDSGGEQQALIYRKSKVTMKRVTIGQPYHLTYVLPKCWRHFTCVCVSAHKCSKWTVKARRCSPKWWSISFDSISIQILRVCLSCIRNCVS